MTTETPATVEELREALQFAIQELLEAGDKLNIFYHNHPGDYGIENKDSPSAIRRREDRDRLSAWADRAFAAKDELRKVLAK